MARKIFIWATVIALIVSILGTGLIVFTETHTTPTNTSSESAQ